MKISQRANMAGFTLLELLAVIALLAILATSALVSFDGSDEQARSDLTHHEIAELRKALMLFRRDNREFPCRVYRVGDYSSDPSIDRMEERMTELEFPSGASGWTAADYADWCANDNPAQIDNALTMLNRFPFGDIETFKHLLWDVDRRRGWNGPYVSYEGLTDAWGNKYRLLDPELDYSQAYRCEYRTSDDSNPKTTIGYALYDDEYSCLTPNDDGWGAEHILRADLVRLVSLGPDGRLNSGIDDYDYLSEDPCEAKGDDIVLCLLR